MDPQGETSNVETKPLGYFDGREAIIFLIDSRKKMLDSDECLVKLALCSVKEKMRHEMFQGRDTLISVVFFGLQSKDPNTTSTTTTAQLFPLSKSSVDNLKELNELVRGGIPDYFNKYTCLEEANLCSALSSCLFMFSSCEVRIRMKRIILITNDDNPDSQDMKKRFQLRGRGRDLPSFGVLLDLIPVGESFEPSLFYKEFMESVRKDDFKIPPPRSELNEIGEMIEKENHSRRRLGRLKFYIGEGVTIGIALYKFTRKYRYIKKQKLYRKTNESIRYVRRQMNMRTKEFVRPYEVMHRVVIAGKSLTVKPDDLNSMKTKFEPGITLLGFKPVTAWKYRYHSKAPYFVHPEETVVKGSTSFFSALWKRCLERQMAPLCVFVSRKKTKPRYVLLVPQEAKVNQTTGFSTPEGFKVLVLPFRNTIADIPEREEISPDSKQLAISKKIIKKLRKSYSPDFFVNAKLMRKWYAIEATELGEFDENNKKFAVPYDEIKQLVDPYLMKYEGVFFPDGYISTQSSKRKLPANKDTSPRKKGSVPDSASIGKLFNQKKIHTLTVVNLKDLLKSIPGFTLALTALKKDKLVDLVYKYKDEIEENYKGTNM